jgi:predicted NBD/HSP70 family sugar kinase
MGKRITTMGASAIGLDPSDTTTEACVLDVSGEVLERFRVHTTAPALERTLARNEPSRVILEVGTTPAG